MSPDINPRKVIASVGQKVPRHCSHCGTDTGFVESEAAVHAVAKWICPNCGTLNQFEIEFKRGTP